jgi:hypothetical protein
VLLRFDDKYILFQFRDIFFQRPNC